MSLKNKILEKIKMAYPVEIDGGEIERFALENRYKASNASRRLRELENEGFIKVSYGGEKHTAKYKYKGGVGIYEGGTETYKPLTQQEILIHCTH